jgi:hypothetical protein
VTVSGNPYIVPAASGTFRAEFISQGALLFDNIPEDFSSGNPAVQNVIMTFRASTISMVNSIFQIDDNETGPSSLSFFADGNLLVDPSVIRVRSGPASGSDAAGVIHLESANGLVSFHGSGYNPTTDPNDLLRTHARATISVGDGIYDGGAVELVSLGNRTGLLGGNLAPLDGVFVYDATIDVAPRDGSGAVTSGNGGQVLLDGRMQVLIEDSVDIEAFGATPGSVTIRSTGNETLAGLITLKVPNSTGHINLQAENSANGFNGGEINLFGYNNAGNYSINLEARGDCGGGTIRASAAGGYYAPSSWVNTYYGLAGINIASARLNADAPAASSLPAGVILLEGPLVTLADAHLSADASIGAVGRIYVAAQNPGGTRIGTTVNLASSTLTVGGASDPDGGIFISGDNVMIDAATMGNFSAGPAQVHIQSRQNTGSWSTNPADPIYWSPLYFIMDNSTTIDVSGSVPTITGTGGSLSGAFNASVAQFDFGGDNVLLWPNNPHSTPTGAGVFHVEFTTSGSFEALDAIPGTGGPSVTETSLISIHAQGIQVVNSIFSMGDAAAPNGPSEFQLFSSTDAFVVSPYDSMNPTAPATVIAPNTGTVSSQIRGGKFHLESAGITALIGGDMLTRLTKVLVGADDVGGTVEIVSTGTGTTTGGNTQGVHVRNAYIDTSHLLLSGYPTFGLSPTIALTGGSVTLNGTMQVNIEGATDIYADGSFAPGSIMVASTGSSIQPGTVIFHVEDDVAPGHVFLSSRLTASSSAASPGQIALFGSTLSGGGKSLNVVASGPAGGGTILAEAPGSVFVAFAGLDASALAGGTLAGGTIRLHAGASATAATGSMALQTYGAWLLARGFDGGVVTTMPSGSGPFYLPASLDMHGTVIDVSSYGGVAAGNTPEGGNVTLQGTMSAAIAGDQYGSTDITADGPATGGTAGGIQVQSPGSLSQGGNVSITADATHYVRLSAHDSAIVFDALNNGGNIEIHGASGRASGNETVRITAGGPTGTGNITISAIQNLSVINAQLNAGGTLSLNGKNILVQNSLLTAALINIAATTRADILNSILQASGINVHAPTVDFAGSTLSSQAQVYANTVVNPPASGTYVQHPYSPPAQ